MKRFVKAVLAAALCLPLISSAGVSYTLVDGNSSFQVEPASPAGASSWVVDGVNQLSQQGLWYRIGGSGPESSIANGTTVVASQPTPNVLFSSFTGTGFKLDLNYSLMGGSSGSGMSDLSESIRIVNTGLSSLDFHLFEYANLNLGGTALNDSAARPNPNTIVQSDLGNLSQTVSTPAGTHWQISLASALSASLNDGAATTLSDSVTPFGPGDVGWAWQWDFNIAPGSAVTISKVNNLAPSVPDTGSTVVLLGLALASFALVRHKFRRGESFHKIGRVSTSA